MSQAKIVRKRLYAQRDTQTPKESDSDYDFITSGDTFFYSTPIYLSDIAPSTVLTLESLDDAGKPTVLGGKVLSFNLQFCLYLPKNGDSSLVQWIDFGSLKNNENINYSKDFQYPIAGIRFVFQAADLSLSKDFLEKNVYVTILQSLSR